MSLANGDGSLRKTNKAALARELEKSASPAEVIPEPSATVIDGMSIVQKMKGNDKTFSQLAESVLCHILHEGANSQRINVVFDVYREMSIKDAERLNRGAEMSIQFRNISPGHNIQQWRKLLSSPSSKASLIKFLVNEWKESRLREKLQDKELYATCEQECFRMTKDKWEEATTLTSTHEEADTRLFLHALHAAESGYKAVVICAEDTDVLVISLAVSSNIPCPMYQKCGTKNRTRYLDITKIQETLGGSVCDALVGMHAFTGCDSIISFAGRRNLTALKHLKSDKTHQEIFSQLGQACDVPTELFEGLHQITCQMYFPSSHTKEVNSCVLNFFVRTVEKWNQASFHLVRTEACSCIHCAPIIKLPHGDNV